MRVPSTTCAVLCLASLIATQGLTGRTPGSGLRKLAPSYPGDVPLYQFAPFVDASGAPVRTPTRALGAADLDGDQNADLWFLGEGTRAGEIAVQFANTAQLARFYRRESLTANFLTAATFHSLVTTADEVLAIDPTCDEPYLLHWNPKSATGDPRDGSLGGSLTGWKIGKGVYEIRTADHTGDGHDDIVVLRALQDGQTLVQKLVMGTQKYSFLWVEETVSFTVPAPVADLRLIDVDGDKRTDICVQARGLGVAICRDTGAGTFQPVGFFETGGAIARDMDTGDFDRDGLEDLAVSFDAGMAVILPRLTANALPVRFDHRVFLNPTGIGKLSSCAILDGDGKGSMLLLGFPADGKSYVLHAANPGQYGVTGPWVETAPSSLTGNGTVSHAVLVSDVDNDGDPDLVVQAPSGSEWMTLRNPAISFAPTGLTIQDKGPAPTSEGKTSRRLDVTVDLPKSLLDAGVLFVEMGFYVASPSSQSQADPDWLYWGRVVPSINSTNQNASFTVFYETNESTFESRVATFEKHRKASVDTFLDVYPKGEWETIRGGPRMWFSIHGIDGRKRFESGAGVEPPKPNGSSLGTRWVLLAKPPSPKGDLDLLPWE